MNYLFTMPSCCSTLANCLGAVVRAIARVFRCFGNVCGEEELSGKLSKLTTEMNNSRKLHRP